MSFRCVRAAAVSRASLSLFPLLSLASSLSSCISISISLSLSLFLATSLSSHRAGGKRTGVAKLRKELERFYQV